jgi:hypothetical protein
MTRAARDRQAGMTAIEVLMVASIGVVVTVMMLLIWFALGDSYSFTTKASKSRELARDAVSRLQREIRDAEPLEGQDAVLSAGPFEISFTTTFNQEGNESDAAEPTLTEYRYDADTRSLWRSRDTNGNDVIDEEDQSRMVVEHLLNTGEGPPVSMFTYTYTNPSGFRQRTDSPDQGLLRTIMLVDVRVLVDLNPGAAPKAMDLSTTVQLRNQRHF